jgi:hypothetical protein
VSAVEERWEMERRGLVGKEDAPPPAAADAAAIREILALLVAGLRASSARFATGERGEDFLGGVREKAAAKIDAIPSEGAFEEIEHELSTIEASLVKAGLKAMNSSFRSLVESRVAEALGDVAGLSPHVVERMRTALTRREVRSLAGFPPLTLLHG